MRAVCGRGILIRTISGQQCKNQDSTRLLCRRLDNCPPPAKKSDLVCMCLLRSHFHIHEHICNLQLVPPHKAKAGKSCVTIGATPDCSSRYPGLEPIGDRMRQKRIGPPTTIQSICNWNPVFACGLKQEGNARYRWLRGHYTDRVLTLHSGQRRTMVDWPPSALVSKLRGPVIKRGQTLGISTSSV